MWSKGSATLRLVDLAAFGRPARLVRRKWRFPARDCAVRSFTKVDERIAPARAARDLGHPPESGTSKRTQDSNTSPPRASIRSGGGSLGRLGG